MSNPNLRIWNLLCRTDPKHTKSFTRAGGFKGTATKPIWTEHRLTETFGPCGIGWGCDEPVFTLVPAADEILVFCTLRCWYAEDGKQASLYGVGGDKVLVKQQSGLRADDEAYKKAFTDALGNAFKHVGSGADVHMGLFDDSKYVSVMRKEFAEEAPQKPADDPFVPETPEPRPNGKSAPASTALPPANPEEPPEVGKARVDMKLLLAAFRQAPTDAAITTLWQRSTKEIEGIKRYGGEAAFALLSDAAQKRLDTLRAGTGD